MESLFVECLKYVTQKLKERVIKPRSTKSIISATSQTRFPRNHHHVDAYLEKIHEPVRRQTKSVLRECLTIHGRDRVGAASDLNPLCQCEVFA